MTVCNLSPTRLPRVCTEQSLTLCWYSVSWWRREGITICFAQNRWRKIPLWLSAIYRWCDYPERMTKHRCRSVNAHFQVGAGWCCNLFCQKFLYDCLQPISGVITQDAWPKIVAAPLAPIFKLGQHGIAIYFAYKGGQKFLYDCLQSISGVITQDAWPKLLPLRWCPFSSWGRKVLQSVLPIMAAKNSFITVCNLSAVWLPRTHDQKLLPLHWRPFSYWGRKGLQSVLPIKAANNSFMTVCNLSAV